MVKELASIKVKDEEIALFRCANCNEIVPIGIKSKTKAIDLIFQMKEHYEISESDIEDYNEFLKESNFQQTSDKGE